MEQKELIAMLEKHRELELTNVKISQEKEEQLKSDGAKLMLKQIRMDSQKHAEILQTLIKIVKEGEPVYLWRHRIDKFVGQAATEKALEKHIEIEKDMIKRTEEAMKNIDDPGINMILNQILEDEKRHHKMLNEVVSKLYKLGS
ncbi:MAG: ferritin family protein [Promethearchaeota archaeon]